MERKWNENGTKMEQKWNKNGTKMERKWNENEQTQKQLKNGSLSCGLVKNLFIFLLPYQPFCLIFHFFLGKLVDMF